MRSAGACVMRCSVQLRAITMSLHPHCHTRCAEFFAADTVIPTGIKHGTVTVLAHGEPIEVTTFRTDGSYTDRRKPDSVRFCRTLEEDLSRRDFTIGAIAYSESEGIIDPYGGRRDIEHRVIRCVGGPHARLSEDALRILRALRFSATLGFPIEPETDRALRELAPLLNRISAERCREELLRLICGRDAVRVLREYVSVLGVIMPSCCRWSALIRGISTTYTMSTNTRSM